jgi:hypothetical protein
LAEFTNSELPLIIASWLVFILVDPPSSIKSYRSPLLKYLQLNRGAELLASVDGVVTELLFDTEDLVELGETLRTGRGTGLDLARAETDSNVGNGDILGLTRAVRDHDAPSGSVRVLGGLDGLGQGTDLVDLEQKSVARLELNGLLNAERVGDSQVVTIIKLVSHQI